MAYPKDGNGDALCRMEAQGDDLARPRNIDFNVVFAHQSSAEQFAKHFRALGHEVSVEATERDQGCPWDVVVVQHMVPSYDGVSNFENLLRSVADRWEGHNGGWGVSLSHLQLHKKGGSPRTESQARVSVWIETVPAALP